MSGRVTPLRLRSGGSTCATGNGSSGRSSARRSGATRCAGRLMSISKAEFQRRAAATGLSPVRDRQFKFEIGARVVPISSPRTVSVGVVVERAHCDGKNLYLISVPEQGFMTLSMQEHLTRFVDG